MATSKPETKNRKPEAANARSGSSGPPAETGNRKRKWGNMGTHGEKNEKRGGEKRSGEKRGGEKEEGKKRVKKG